MSKQYKQVITYAIDFTTSKGLRFANGSLEKKANKPCTTLSQCDTMK